MPTTTRRRTSSFGVAGIVAGTTGFAFVIIPPLPAFRPAGLLLGATAVVLAAAAFLTRRGTPVVAAAATIGALTVTAWVTGIGVRPLTETDPTPEPTPVAQVDLTGCEYVTAGGRNDVIMKGTLSHQLPEPTGWDLTIEYTRTGQEPDIHRYTTPPLPPTAPGDTPPAWETTFPATGPGTCQVTAATPTTPTTLSTD